MPNPTPSNAMVALQQFLKRKNHPYAMTHGTMEVAGPLPVLETAIFELPDDLTVFGHLVLDGQNIWRLPERFRVTGDLFIRHMPIREIPASLSVGGVLDLSGTKKAVLPENFHLDGSLNLTGVPLTALPRGVIVGGDLDLTDTKIVAFPPDMHVGGIITAPCTLGDIRAFMKTQKLPWDEVVLEMPGTQHLRMELLDALQAWPDLCTVVSAMVSGQALRIQKRLIGGFRVWME